MLNVQVGEVSVKRQGDSRVEIGLGGFGWSFQTVNLAEAKLIGTALIAAAEEVEDA